MSKYLIFIFLLVGSNFASYVYHSDLKQIFEPKDDKIIAKITLQTNCEMMPEAFIIRDLETDKFVRFGSSTVYLRTLVGNSLQVQLDPKFSDISSNFDLHDAQKTMLISLDCDISNSLQNTLKSLRDTFKTD
jgi:hypothetical protein